MHTILEAHAEDMITTYKGVHTLQISNNRADLIMRNGHELTYQNAESKRLCMLDSLDFESKDYKKRILLPPR